MLPLHCFFRHVLGGYAGIAWPSLSTSEAFFTARRLALRNGGSHFANLNAPSLPASSPPPILIQVYVPVSATETLDFLRMEEAGDFAELMRAHLGFQSVQHALHMGGRERFHELPVLRRSPPRFLQGTFDFGTLPTWISQAPQYPSPAAYATHEARISRWFLLVLLGFLNPPAPLIAFTDAV